MAFLGGLALLGSAGEAYQSAKGKQYALDEAALDQEASKALGTIGQQLAQLGGGLPPLGTPVAGGPQQPPAAGGGPSFASPQQGGQAAGQPQIASGDLPGLFTPTGQPYSSTDPATFASRTGQWDTMGHNPVGQPVTQPTPGSEYQPQPQVPPGIMAQLAARLQAQGGGGAPGGQPQPGMGGSPAGAQPPPAQPPGAAQRPPGVQPSMTPGQMDLPTLARMIQQGTPGIKPEVFARALAKGAALLHPFAKDQLQQMMLQMRQEQIDETQRHHQATEMGGKGPDEGMAAAIARYDAPPMPAWRPGSKETMDRVLELNPNYDAKKYAGGLARERAEATLPAKEEMSFITKDSGAVKAFDVLVPHLQTLGSTIDALEAAGSGNFRPLNALRNLWKREFGSNVPTDFEAVKNIVSYEMVRAIQGTAGALYDRTQLQKDLDAANSPTALRSVVSRYRELATGQLRGLAKKYKSQTNKDDFEERFLSEEARELFLGESKGKSDKGGGKDEAGDEGWGQLKVH